MIRLVLCISRGLNHTNEREMTRKPFGSMKGRNFKQPGLLNNEINPLV